MSHSVRLTGLLLCLALPAAAADPFARGFDAVPLKASPTMQSGLLLEGAEMNPARSFQLYGLLDLNLGILSLKLGDAKLGDLIPFRGDLHLMGAYQLTERIELAADLPLTFFQLTNFRLLTDSGFPQESPKAVGLDDWRFVGRFQILSQETFRVLSLTAIAELRIPIGDGFSFLGDLGFVFAPRVAVERRFGLLRLRVNIGWRFRTAAAQYLNLYVGQEFTTGVGASFDLPDQGRFTKNQVLAEVNLSTPAEAPFTFSSAAALKTPFALAVGMRSQFLRHWGASVTIGRGLGLQNGYGRETFRLMLGIKYEHIEEPDRDGDGIPDSVDNCPDTPEDLDGYQDEDGCPEPDPDSDGDGVPDNKDGCKDVPGPQEYDGCPDRDGDQIPDNVDKCPDEPGPAENEGCPVPKDEEVVLESDRIRVRGNILFETGMAIIQRQSYKMLDDVAKVLLDHPEVGPVSIEGHTDNRGTRNYNIDLSNRRAKAVEDYLVGKGVVRKRLRTAGFGFDKPVSTNDTPLGRAKNRRTDFRLIENENADAGTSAPAPAPAPVPVEPHDAGTAPKPAPTNAPPIKPAPVKPTLKPTAPAPKPQTPQKTGAQKAAPKPSAKPVTPKP